MLHTVVIGLHAASGVVALASGLQAMRGGRLLRTHLWSLVATIAWLAVAVALDWAALPPAGRVLFAGFTALGGHMVWRAVQALRRRPAPGVRPSVAYVRDLGFNLVALSDAFLVIAVLDLGAPVAVVVATGVAVAVAGHFVLVRVERAIAY